MINLPYVYCSPAVQNNFNLSKICSVPLKSTLQNCSIGLILVGAGVWATAQERHNQKYLEGDNLRIKIQEKYVTALLDIKND